MVKFVVEVADSVIQKYHADELFKGNERKDSKVIKKLCEEVLASTLKHPNKLTKEKKEQFSKQCADYAIQKVKQLFLEENPR